MNRVKEAQQSLLTAVITPEEAGKYNLNFPEVVMIHWINFKQLQRRKKYKRRSLRKISYWGQLSKRRKKRKKKKKRSKEVALTAGAVHGPAVDPPLALDVDVPLALVLANEVVLARERELALALDRGIVGRDPVVDLGIDERGPVVVTVVVELVLVHGNQMKLSLKYTWMSINNYFFNYCF